MWIVYMTTDFFVEIRPIEELQGSKISPRREEVGRHTLRALGGFLLAFFYQANFGLLTQQILPAKMLCVNACR